MSQTGFKRFACPVTFQITRQAFTVVIISIVIIFSVGLISMPAAEAEVKCSCKTIDAEGEGNTSCTANESGGKCTIDYNLFAQREVRAAAKLRQILNLSVTTYPRLDATRALQQAAMRRELPKQILLYLLVATVDQQESYPRTVDNNIYRAVERAIMKRSVSGTIENEFHPAAMHRYKNFRTTNLSSSIVKWNRNGIVVSPGCISVDTRYGSVMFKTHWSPLRRSPRCLP